MSTVEPGEIRAQLPASPPERAEPFADVLADLDRVLLPGITELEELTLSWLAQLLGLPAAWHGHIEDTASISTLAALCAARTAAPDRRVVVASEQAHSSVDRACRILGLEIR